MSSQIGSEFSIQFLLSRRSIRKFKPDIVDMNIIKRILDIARYAPSSGNRQPWIFIIVTDKNTKDKLANIHPWAYPLKEAPVGILVACNKDVSPETYHVDCANATMYIMLAAHALGLGTVWLNTLKHIAEIQKILSLPPNYIPISMLALGYPNEIPTPRPRKELSEIVFLNAYGNKLEI